MPGVIFCVPGAASATLIFEKTLWTNYAIQVNLRGIWEILVDKQRYLK